MIKRFWNWLTGKNKQVNVIESVLPLKQEDKPTTTVPVVGRVENPAYKESLKYEGKKETDKKFGAFVSAFFAKVGLPSYKTIVGTSFAWCAIWIGLMNSEVGQKYVVKSGAAAISYDAYGTPIDWKTQGIPRGAVVRINSGENCKSSTGNHVTFAHGDCAVQDIIEMVKNAQGVYVPSGKPKNVNFIGFGGNQGDEVKASSYSIKKICHVGWPTELPKPGKITKSINCAGAKDSSESTR